MDSNPWSCTEKAQTEARALVANDQKMIQFPFVETL